MEAMVQSDVLLPSGAAFAGDGPAIPPVTVP